MSISANQRAQPPHPPASIYWRSCSRLLPDPAWASGEGLDERQDIVIVGGGFAGLATAWRLAEAAPSRRILLLEANAVGHGASGRAGGILTRLPLLAAWMVKGSLPDGLRQQAIGALLDVTERTLDDLEAVSAGVRRGQFLLSARDQISARIVRWIANGAPLARVKLEALSGRAVKDMCGARSTGGVVQAARRIQPYDTCLHLAHRVTALGVRIVEGVRLNGFLEREGGVELTLEGRQITAKTVIICGNAYLGKPLAESVGGQRARVTHTYAIATEPLPSAAIQEMGGENLMVGEISLGLEYRRMHEGRLIFGAHGVAGLVPGDDTTFNRHQLTRVQRTFRKRLPMLEGIRIEHGWGGAYLEAAEGCPMIRPLSPNSKVVLNMGFGGGGVSLALASGLIVRGLVLPDLDSPEAALIRAALETTHTAPLGFARAALEVLAS